MILCVYNRFRSTCAVWSVLEKNVLGSWKVPKMSCNFVKPERRNPWVSTVDRVMVSRVM